MTDSALDELGGRTEAEYEADQATLDVLRRGRREPPLEEQVHSECRRDDVDESGGLRDLLDAGRAELDDEAER